jgi:hypothetical protein
MIRPSFTTSLRDYGNDGPGALFSSYNYKIALQPGVRRRPAAAFLCGADSTMS